MNWLRNLFGGALDSSQEGVKSIRDKFRHFLSLLEENNRVLKVISDMEEKAQGDFLFDINYIRESLVKSRKSIHRLINDMIESWIRERVVAPGLQVRGERMAAGDRDR